MEYKDLPMKIEAIAWRDSYNTSFQLTFYLQKSNFKANIYGIIRMFTNKI